ncbi:DUF1850 domain-containing protein [Nonomuraea sp. NPDC050556]|uniref:DUF1850 domain-containing protein n=1 Tax=Nonomuraea sp. NPDC050556 TaxID=3364369 RepID=UPI003799A9D0
MVALALCLSGSSGGRPAIGGLPLSGEWFALGYVHSVHHAPSAEIFTVGDDAFTMRAVVSTSGGVLDYYAIEGQRSRLPGGMWVLWLDAPATYTSLDLIASPVGRRTLVSGRGCLPLFPSAGANAVRLELETVAPGTPAQACPEPYNQPFFLNTVYSQSDRATRTAVDIQKPQGWPEPG